MSPNPYPVFAIPKNAKPEHIERRIKLLIKLYLSQHERDIAVAVIAHVNALLSCPKYITDVETRCQLRHLVCHWRCLAWNNGIAYRKKTTQIKPKLELKQISHK
jgi:hypothetical protein